MGARHRVHVDVVAGVFVDAGSDPVKLAVIRDALDRAGLKPATIVDLELNAKPWESVFEGIIGILFGPGELTT